MIRLIFSCHWRDWSLLPCWGHDGAEYWADWGPLGIEVVRQ